MRTPLSLCLVLGLAASAQAQPAPDTANATGVGRVVLTRTRVSGVDPIVGRFVDRQLLRTAQALGREPVPAAEVQRALEREGAAVAVSMRELWTLIHRTDAEHGFLALVWAQGGEYRVRLGLASRDGRGPFQGETRSDAPGLEAAVDTLARELWARALAPPEAAPTGTAAPAAAGTTPPASAPAQPEPANTAPPITTEPAPAQQLLEERPLRFYSDAAPAPAPARHAPVRFGIRMDPAFGVGEHDFFNLLIGVRGLYRITAQTAAGGYLGYVNLRTRGGRGVSVLPALAFEHDIPIGQGAFSVPIRLLLGGLVNNGSVLRLSSGLAWSLDGATRLSLDLLSPTFWVTPDRTLLSLDLGLELSTDF